MTSPMTRDLPVDLHQVLLAGFSARSKDVRQQHIDELRRLGIEPPDRVPAFWPVSAALATTADRIQVQGADTSGEIEFALLFAAGRVLVGVASDQTDRALEVQSIPRSKQLCAKVLSRDMLPLDGLRRTWDAIVISSDVRDADGTWRPYQRAALATMLDPDALVRACFGEAPVPDGTLLLSGTVPILDGHTRYAPAFRGRLEVPGWDDQLRIEYDVEAMPDRFDAPPPA
jgi:hypothetical protein